MQQTTPHHNGLNITNIQWMNKFSLFIILPWLFALSLSNVAIAQGERYHSEPNCASPGELHRYEVAEKNSSYSEVFRRYPQSFIRTLYMDDMIYQSRSRRRQHTNTDTCSPEYGRRRDFDGDGRCYSVIDLQKTLNQYYYSYSMDDIWNLELIRVDVVAKSRNGCGHIALKIDSEDRGESIVGGQRDEWEESIDHTTFYGSLLYNNGDSHGPWELWLKGSIKVREIILVVRQKDWNYPQTRHPDHSYRPPRQPRRPDHIARPPRQPRRPDHIARPPRQPRRPDHIARPPRQPRRPDHIARPPRQPRRPDHIARPPRQPRRPDHNPRQWDNTYWKDMGSKKIETMLGLSFGGSSSYHFRIGQNNVKSLKITCKSTTVTINSANVIFADGTQKNVSHQLGGKCKNTQKKVSIFSYRRVQKLVIDAITPRTGGSRGIVKLEAEITY